ncbi:hypothetical protein PYCC9005_002062 [Savitreella phatthalungensis]
MSAASIDSIPDNEDPLSFVKAYTGIDDTDELRRRQEATRAASRDSFQFRCCDGRFVRPTIERFPRWKALKDHHRHDGTRIFEVGSCFCQDLRCLLYHGFPADTLGGTDITRTYHDASTILFGDDLSTKISMHFGPFKASDHKKPYDLVLLSNVLHCLTRELVADVVHQAFLLLSDRWQASGMDGLEGEGGMLWGVTVAQHEEGPWEMGGSGGRNSGRWLHSPESLKQLLLNTGFKAVNVQVIRSDTARDNPGDNATIRVYFEARK